MGYRYDRRSKQAFNPSNLKMIVQGMISARNDGFESEDLVFDPAQFKKDLDNTCQRIQRLSRGPANFAQEFNSIAAALYAVAAQYGALARPD